MSILAHILDSKMEEIHRLRAETNIVALHERAMSGPACIDLTAALRNCSHVSVIAEIKRSSPSQGALADVHDVGQLAQTYEQAGASAVSVLTDGPFFGGSLGDLRQVRDAVNLPILRKDFILDPIQICEARVAGADAVLLIAAALPSKQLSSLFETTVNLGMTAVVEVHHEAELARVLGLSPRIIGINNRNLSTLQVDLETFVRLRPLVPQDILVLAESGISGPEDIAMLREAGADAFLIGTTLMRSQDPGAALRRLCCVEG
ncbi:MAG: indole-3-glycerol phosphate synthase TrpC [Thermodesulfobacteriota bacterium]